MNPLLALNQRGQFMWLDQLVATVGEKRSQILMTAS